MLIKTVLSIATGVGVWIWLRIIGISLLVLKPSMWPASPLPRRPGSVHIDSTLNSCPCERQLAHTVAGGTHLVAWRAASVPPASLR